VDRVLDDERKTDRRSESPQSYDPGFHSLPPLYSTVQGTSASGIGTVGRSIGTIPSSISPVTYFPYTGVARLRTNMSARQSSSEFSVTRTHLAIRANTTGAQFTLRRDTSTVLPNPAIGSQHGSDPSDLPSDELECQSGAESSNSPPSRP
jgi:hypothetical protein